MSRVLFDFSAAGSVQGWSAIDDRVMGGASRSRLRHHASGHAVFEGEVSLARNGGFASVRCAAQALGQAGAATCEILARGAPGPFKLNLFTDDGFDSISYQCGFVAGAGDWQLIQLPLRSFRARFRGREVPGAPPLDPVRLRQVGLMTAERRAGPFALDIRRIGLG